MKCNTFLTVFIIFFLLNHNKIKCQNIFHLGHAKNNLYSFEKIAPHEIRNSLKNVIGNFLIKHIETIKNKFYKNEKDKDVAKNEYEISLENKIKHLLQKAQNAKIASQKIKKSYNRAFNNLKKKSNNKMDEEKTKKVLESNLEQINYLSKKSDYLKKKAEELKKYLEETNVKNYEYNNTCNLYKGGKLKFVSSSNGLKHSIDNVQGQVNNNGFTIFYKNKKKLAYNWNDIELPIKFIGNIEQCFFFPYKNTNQFFCAENKLASYSWVNSLTEAMICHLFGINGTVVNKNVTSNDNINDKKKNTNDDSLIVDVKPEEKNTRLFVNGMEQKVDNESGVINLNQIKKKLDDEKRIRKNESSRGEDFESEDKNGGKNGGKNGSKNEDEDEDEDEDEGEDDDE